MPTSNSITGTNQRSIFEPGIRSESLQRTPLAGEGLRALADAETQELLDNQQGIFERVVDSSLEANARDARQASNDRARARLGEQQTQVTSAGGRSPGSGALASNNFGLGASFSPEATREALSIRNFFARAQDTRNRVNQQRLIRTQGRVDENLAEEATRRALGVADIDRDTQLGVAGLNSRTQLGLANINQGTEIAVARINNETAERINRRNFLGNLGANFINQIGQF